MQPFTPQARGLVSRGLKRKRDTVKRDPYPVKLVRSWESMVADVAEQEDLTKETIAKCVFIGFILRTIHSRSRFGDAARVSMEPKLDIADGRGFVETAAKFGEYKTGYEVRKAGRLLPMVGSAFGVSGRPWAEAWLQRCVGGVSLERRLRNWSAIVLLRA